MRLTTLLLIVSIFTFVFDGKELCFKNNGEVHLSCCCKDSPSIKMPCCGNNCKTVDIPSIDIAQQKPENENDLNSEFDEVFSSTSFNPSEILQLSDIPSFRPIYRSDHSYRPGSLSNLSSVILRC
jgi:hypothetical protein